MRGAIPAGEALVLVIDGWYLMPRQGTVPAHVTDDKRRELLWVSDAAFDQLIGLDDVVFRDREGFGYARRTTPGHRRTAQSRAKRIKELGAMFETKDVLVTIDTMKISAEDTAKGESIRMVELKIVIPVLPHDLAADIDTRIAEHLFANVGGDWRPRTECEAATWRLGIPMQIMTIKAAADASGEHRFPTVDVRKVQTKAQKDTGAQSLAFVVAFEQPPARELAWLAKNVTAIVAISFEPETPSLTEAAS